MIIDVDDEYVVSSRGKCAASMDDVRRFSGTPFLIRYGDSEVFISLISFVTCGEFVIFVLFVSLVMVDAFGVLSIE